MAGVVGCLLPAPVKVEAVMAILKRTILLAALLVTASGSVAGAEQSGGSAKHPQLTILNTVSNRSADTLTVHGVGFGDRPAQVWCENFLLTVISWTDSEIILHLPDAVPDGSYLLTIITGEGQKDQGVFDMTLQGH